jgi:hypothetical protein
MTVTKTTELKTYTEEEMLRIVEFNGAVERLRERTIQSMNLALQRARAAGDAKETIAALEWHVGNIELGIRNFVHQSQQPQPEPEKKPEEPAPDE